MVTKNKLVCMKVSQSDNSIKRVEHSTGRTLPLTFTKPTIWANSYEMQLIFIFGGNTKYL